MRKDLDEIIYLILFEQYEKENWANGERNWVIFQIINGTGFDMTFQELFSSHFIF